MIPPIVLIEDNKQLARDTYSKGIINTDTVGYKNALEKHRIAMLKVVAESKRDERINRLEKDLSEIKDLMKQLLIK